MVRRGVVLGTSFRLTHAPSGRGCLVVEAATFVSSPGSRPTPLVSSTRETVHPPRHPGRRRARRRGVRTLPALHPARADELIRVRLEAGPMPDLDLDEFSGIFVGGGPSTPPTRPRRSRLCSTGSRPSSPRCSTRSSPATSLPRRLLRRGHARRPPGCRHRRHLPRAHQRGAGLADRGRGIRPAPRGDAAHVRGLRRPQGGDHGAAALRRAAGVVADLPGADVPGRHERLRDAVPPRTRRRRRSARACACTPATDISPPTSSS